MPPDTQLSTHSPPSNPNRSGQPHMQRVTFGGIYTSTTPSPPSQFSMVIELMSVVAMMRKSPHSWQSKITAPLVGQITHSAPCKAFSLIIASSCCAMMLRFCASPSSPLKRGSPSASALAIVSKSPWQAWVTTSTEEMTVILVNRLYPVIIPRF